ncbi:MAG: hypothetical protein K2Y51_26000 [Gammaproteobacteria bacterium]|nr:hypothetical protein [Gammaproteobacteria bacterium]
MITSDVFNGLRFYLGLSTDTKPTPPTPYPLKRGDEFFETDTLTNYRWDGKAWGRDELNLNTLVGLAKQNQMLDPTRQNNGRGTLICDWSNGASGTPSTVDVWPESPTIYTSIPQGSGSSGSYIANLSANGAAITNVPSTFNNLNFWFKADPTADGEKYGMYQLQMSSDDAATAIGNSWANKVFGTFTARRDGKWRLLSLHKQQLGVSGTFTLGSSNMNSARVIDTAPNTSLTLTGAPAVGDLSATLNANFAGTSNPYRLRFSSGEVRNAQLTNGSTAVVWDRPLTAVATTAVVYGGTSVRLGMQVGDRFQIGPVYTNSGGRGFAYVRFDDCTRDQIAKRMSIGSPFNGASGVVIPANTPMSMIDIVEAFGLKASLFVLTGYLQVVRQGYATVEDLLNLQARGHAICLQAHANPFDGGNAGARLLGPYGFYLAQNRYGSISSVDTNSDTITTSATHGITRVVGANLYGNQGYPVTFFNTTAANALPAPLVAGQTYWLRNTSTTAFAVHLTEEDSCAGVNTIDLTSGGTPANFGYRYAGSAPNESAILADFRAGQALMKQWGLNGYQHIAVNQGAIDVWVEEALRQLKASGEVASVSLVLGSTGASASNFIPRNPVSHSTGGLGAAGQGFAATVSDINTFPVALQTDSGSDITSTGTNLVAPFIDALATQGQIASNYHHFLLDAVSMTNLISFCDRLAFRSRQNVINTGTVIDAYNALVSMGVEPSHV